MCASLWTGNFFVAYFRAGAYFSCLHISFQFYFLLHTRTHTHTHTCACVFTASVKYAMKINKNSHTDRTWVVPHPERHPSLTIHSPSPTDTCFSFTCTALQLYLEFAVFVFRNVMRTGHFGGRRSIKHRPPQRTALIFSFHFTSLHVGDNVLIRQQKGGKVDTRQKFQQNGSSNLKVISESKKHVY